ncbi:hypothetical protein AB0O31_03155 [Kitasatospora cineracea]|uniref:hypothetical protein n=1 Tax=Kitasatospora cineracea TaxID=88074 RepID=UPI00343A6B61
MTAKSPDKPFDFNLDAVRSDVELTPFVVQFSGTRWTLEHMQSLNVWTILDSADKGDVSAMLGVFEAALGHAVFAVFRTKPLKSFQLQALFRAYQQHCGFAPGESPASTSS